MLHEPPRRVRINLPDSDVSISDYLFPGESTEASAKAVEEYFGFIPELEDLDDELELVASPKQVVVSDHLSYWGKKGFAVPYRHSLNVLMFIVPTDKVTVHDGTPPNSLILPTSCSSVSEISSSS